MQNKKIIKYIILIIILIVLVIGGRAFVLTKMANYKNTIDESINNYFISNNSSDLNPISDLLKKYSVGDKVRNNIQDYTYEQVSKWINYYDTKYTCDTNNINSCSLLKNEYESLLLKIKKVYNYRNIEGFTLIKAQDYASAKEQINKKNDEIESILNNPNSTEPENEVQIKERKCNSTNDCTNCNNSNGLCICNYINEKGIREEITCKKNISQ